MDLIQRKLDEVPGSVSCGRDTFSGPSIEPWSDLESSTETKLFLASVSIIEGSILAVRILSCMRITSLECPS